MDGAWFWNSCMWESWKSRVLDTKVKQNVEKVCIILTYPPWQLEFPYFQVSCGPIIPSFKQNPTAYNPFRPKILNATHIQYTNLSWRSNEVRCANKYHLRIGSLIIQGFIWESKASLDPIAAPHEATHRQHRTTSALMNPSFKGFQPTAPFEKTNPCDAKVTL